MGEVGTFVVEAQEGQARAGRFVTPHGVVRTPAFMPVGTAGSVKGLAPWQLQSLGPEMVLANTYHLLIRPGVETIERLGGLHRFMGWSGPILTDSGGFQVFSLSKLRALSSEGVRFRSHVDGQELFLSPETCLAAQRRLGVDVAMVLDVCPPLPSPPEELKRAVELTTAWARRSRQAHPKGETPLLFGIVQGGLDLSLRRRSLSSLVPLDFDGYALGGFSVGEPPEAMWEAVAQLAPELPLDRPRYLMGVGTVKDIVEAVAAGIDLFDCVIPTRNARNGLLHTSQGPVVVKQARYRECGQPPDPLCQCPTCRSCSLAYLRHLYLAREAAFVVLATVHNLHFYLTLMRQLRSAIIASRFAALRARLTTGVATALEAI